MKKPLLSIVTISFNNLAGLQETISSLLQQSSHDFQQWIIDGGSIDGTKDYLENLSVPWDLHWISEKDQGRYEAMNKGTARSEGLFTWYLNSGDSLADPQVIKDVLNQISENPNVDFIYGKIQFLTSFGKAVSGRSADARDFKYFMPVSHPGILFKTDLVRAIPYRTDFQMISDWILIRTFFKKYQRRLFWDRVLVLFDTQGISSTHRWKDLAEKIIYTRSLSGKFSLLIICGSKYFLLGLLQKTGLYRFYKKWD